MAVLRSVLAIGEVLAVQLRAVAYAAVEVSVLLATLLDPPVADPYDTVDAGSQDDVDSDDDVDAESLLQDDSRLDSVSVEPVLPIDMVLPICMPIAFIGLVSVTMRDIQDDSNNCNDVKRLRDESILNLKLEFITEHQALDSIRQH